MRRFASVFASKREKHDSSHSTINRATTLGPSGHAHSSASSSSGSTSLQTPDDDHHRSPTTLQPKKSWKSWLKVSPIKHPTHKWDNKPIPDWSSHPDTLPHDFDEQDDFVSDESEPFSMPIIPNSSSEPLTTSPSPPHARQNLHLIVSNSLVPLSHSCSPFIQHPDSSSIFPRSCNATRDLPRGNSMLSTMLKTRLLNRLEDSSWTLSHAEQTYIAPLGNRQISPAASLGSSSLSFDEPAPWKKALISLSSPGLHRWRSRPCFEDRYNVFIPTDEGVFRQRVTGTTLAVAALEYSEALDAIAGYVDDVAPLPSPVLSLIFEAPPTEPHSSVQSSPSPPSLSQPPCECLVNILFYPLP